MQPVKQDALGIVGEPPDDTDLDETMYRLYVLDKVRKGQQAVERGRTVNTEEFKREIESW